EITPEVVRRFIRHLETKKTARCGEKNVANAEDGKPVRFLSPATINNCLITLRKLMNDCGYSIRIRYKVPTSGYGWIKEAEEVARFRRACGEGWFRMAAELAVYAALRKGEIAGLERDAIDFERALIRVDRSYDGPTKGKRVRWVPLAPQLAAR